MQIITSPVRRILALAAAVAAVVTLVGVGRLDPAGATEVAVQTDVTYIVEDGIAQKLDAYLPQPPTPASPAVIVVHGGGWQGGDKRDWAAPAKQLAAETGFPVFAINYNLKAKTPYWTEFWQTLSALQWVKDNAARYNVDPARVALMGDSAGGHLSMLAGTWGTGDSSQAYRAKAVVSLSGISDMAQVAIDAGCTNGSCTTPDQFLASVITKYLKSSLDQNPSRWATNGPINHVDPSDPPMLLAATNREFVGLNQVTGMAAKLSANDIRVDTVTLPGTAHGLQLFPEAWPQVVRFLTTQL